MKEKIKLLFAYIIIIPIVYVILQYQKIVYGVGVKGEPLWKTKFIRGEIHCKRRGIMNLRMAWRK